MKYRLIESNKHFVVEINDNYYVLDTGSNSVTVSNINVVRINDKPYHLGKAFEVTKEELYKLTNMDIAGIIGLDILDEGFTIDRKNKTITFGNDDLDLSNAKAINLNRGLLYTFDFKFLGKTYKAILDSGAIISYLDINLDNLNETGYSYDYSPLIKKEINGKSYDILINSNNNDYSIKIGTPELKLLNVFKMLGVNGVIGFYDLFNEFARIENNKLYLK